MLSNVIDLGRNFISSTYHCNTSNNHRLVAVESEKLISKQA